MLFNAIDKSIYENFKPIPFHCVGWGAESEIFATLIKEIRPISILEIGSWHGKSAITMAKCAKSLGLQFTITCVDTWLGALEFWENPDGDRDLRMVNGFPQVYYQFLSNVVHSGFKENILPFPITSNIAYRFFQNKNTKFDLIYIDASHNYDDVYSDMRFLNLLSPSGIIFGHDYLWESVATAVHDYCKNKNPLLKPVLMAEEFWVIRNKI